MTLPKLNLRDLIWLVLVVSMGFAWWVDRLELAESNRLLWHAVKTGEGVFIGGDLAVTPRCSGKR